MATIVIHYRHNGDGGTVATCQNCDWTRTYSTEGRALCFAHKHIDTHLGKGA